MTRGGPEYALSWVALVITVVIMVMAGVVLRAYSQAYGSVVRSTGRPPAHGLVVWHVVAISGASVGLWALVSVSQLDRVGLTYVPVMVRLIWTIAAGVLWIAALLIIARQSRRRVHVSGRSTVAVVESQSTVVHDDGP